MGRDFDERFDASRRVYDEASEALPLDLRRLCFAPDSRLALTEYAQPAILATEIAMLRGLAEAFGMTAQRFGGHSLGEYTGLVAAGVIPLGDAVRIVRERGRLMQEAVPVGRGRMVAVIGQGLDGSVIERALDGLTVTVANDNSPDQVVLSGLGDDVRAAQRRPREGAAGPAVRCGDSSRRSASRSSRSPTSAPPSACSPRRAGQREVSIALLGRGPRWVERLRARHRPEARRARHELLRGAPRPARGDGADRARFRADP